MKIRICFARQVVLEGEFEVPEEFISAYPSSGWDTQDIAEAYASKLENNHDLSILALEEVFNRTTGETHEHIILRSGITVDEINDDEEVWEVQVVE